MNTPCLVPATAVAPYATIRPQSQVHVDRRRLAAAPYFHLSRSRAPKQHSPADFSATRAYLPLPRCERDPQLQRLRA